jgi:hypothetical protein
VCETVHGFAVDHKLPIYSRTTHFFCECRMRRRCEATSPPQPLPNQTTIDRFVMFRMLHSPP